MSGGLRIIGAGAVGALKDIKITKYTPPSDITSTSTTMVDIDATNLPALSSDLAVGDIVELTLSAPWSHSASGTIIGVDWLIDQPTSADTNIRGSSYAAWTIELGTNAFDINSLTAYATFTATEAGVHTFKPQWRTSTGTARIEGGGTYTTPVFHILKNLGKVGAAFTQSASNEFIGVKAYRSAAYNVPSGGGTAIPWDNEEFDTHNFHDNTTANTRLTVPSGQSGYYLVGGTWNTTVGVGDQVRVLMSIHKNGTIIRGGRGESQGSGSAFNAPAVSVLVNLAVGDYVELLAGQLSGSDKDLDRTTSAFWMYKVGT